MIKIASFQVKINGSNDEMLRAAAEQFGSKECEVISHSDPFDLRRSHRVN